jgi:glycosyltransferase involved in cell wall biosynthesis
MSKISLSVFLPAYNESGTITELFFKTNLALKTLRVPSEVIFVDDGSTDKTWSKVKSVSKKYSNVRLFRHSKNLGLTAAFNTCFKNARGEVVIFLPSDLQSNPVNDIPKLWTKINAGYDLVTGERKNHSGINFLDSNVFNFLLRFLFHIPSHDANWIKAFKKKVFFAPLKERQHRLLVPIAKMQGSKIGTVPVTYFPRQYGISKFGLGRIPFVIIDILKLRFL